MYLIMCNVYQILLKVQSMKPVPIVTSTVRLMAVPLAKIEQNQSKTSMYFEGKESDIYLRQRQSIRKTWPY